MPAPRWYSAEPGPIPLAPAGGMADAGGSGGVMDADEGRTHFLAIWGIWLGVVFMLAIAFNMISVFWIGPCAG